MPINSSEWGNKNAKMPLTYKIKWKCNFGQTKCITIIQSVACLCVSFVHLTFPWIMCCSKYVCKKKFPYPNTYITNHTSANIYHAVFFFSLDIFVYVEINGAQNTIQLSQKYTQTLPISTTLEQWKRTWITISHLFICSTQNSSIRICSFNIKKVLVYLWPMVLG